MLRFVLCPDNQGLNHSVVHQEQEGRNSHGECHYYQDHIGHSAQDHSFLHTESHQYKSKLTPLCQGKGEEGILPVVQAEELAQDKEYYKFDPDQSE